MLTSTTPEDLTAAGQDGAYRCWAAAYPLHEAISIPLGSHDAPSSRLALRWLRERTRNGHGPTRHGIRPAGPLLAAGRAGEGGGEVVGSGTLVGLRSAHPLELAQHGDLTRSVGRGLVGDEDRVAVPRALKQVDVHSQEAPLKARHTPPVGACRLLGRHHNLCLRVPSFDSLVEQSLKDALALIFSRQPVTRRNPYLQALAGSGFDAA